MPETNPEDLPDRGYEPWRAGLEQGVIRLTRCRTCRRWQWYPLVACPECGSTGWDWEDAGSTGTLHSWTRVVRPTVRRPGLGTPYVVGIIELPQAGGARVVALSGMSAGDPAIGASVALKIRRIGLDPVLYFQPLSGVE